MSLSVSLGRWVEILEEGYGFPANPVPSTSEEIADMEDFWQCDMEGEFRELLEYCGNGIFTDILGSFLPHVLLRQPCHSFRRRPVDEYAKWDPVIGFPNVDPAPCGPEDFLEFATGGGFEVGIVFRGPAMGAVWTFDPEPGPPFLVWAARSLSDLFDNCCHHVETGAIEVCNSTMGFRWLIRQPSILPFEAGYEQGDRLRGAWRWDL